MTNDHDYDGEMSAIRDALKDKVAAGLAQLAPMLNFDETTGDVNPPGQVPLFKLNGVTYTVEDRAKPALALKYLWMAKNKGESEAQLWLLEAILGEGGYEALMNYDQLTPAQLTAVMELAQQTVLGGLEAGKGGAG